MINREWVTLLYLFSRHWSHQWSLTPWPTESEWHCFISLPGSLMIMSHPTWSTESEWHCGLGLINHLSSHDQQFVSDTAALFLCQAVPLIMSHPTWSTEGEWHCLIFLPGSLINHVSSHGDQQPVSDTLDFFARQSHNHWVSWHPMTNSMWVTLLYSLPGSLSIMSHPMTNS